MENFELIEISEGKYINPYKIAYVRQHGNNKNHTIIRIGDGSNAEYITITAHVKKVVKRIREQMEDYDE